MGCLQWWIGGVRLGLLVRCTGLRRSMTAHWQACRCPGSACMHTHIVEADPALCSLPAWLPQGFLWPRFQRCAQVSMCAQVAELCRPAEVHPQHNPAYLLQAAGKAPWWR